MKIARNKLLVRSLADLRAFYCGPLGMQAFDSEGALLGYDADQCLLEFVEGATAPPYDGGDGLYWKIGITLEDLGAAVAHLRSEGIEVSDPRQFQEIGYMCHLRDPEGFAIELLQQGFEGNHTPLARSADHPIAGQATLAHVTLRICDLDAAKALCEARLGMRLMSVQPVVLPERTFTLYFYAWSDEPLPDRDLTAVANREWLWTRPYTLLELQHLEGGGVDLRHRAPSEAGFLGLGYGEGLDDLSSLDAAVLDVMG